MRPAFLGSAVPPTGSVSIEVASSSAPLCPRRSRRARPQPVHRESEEIKLIAWQRTSASESSSAGSHRHCVLNRRWSLQRGAFYTPRRFCCARRHREWRDPHLPSLLVVCADDPPIIKAGNVARYDFDEKDYIQVRVRSGDFVSKKVFVAVLEELSKTKMSEGLPQPLTGVEEQIDRARTRSVLPIFMNAFEGNNLAAISRPADAGTVVNKVDPRYLLSLARHLLRSMETIKQILKISSEAARLSGGVAGIKGLIAEIQKNDWVTHHDWLVNLMSNAEFRLVMVAITRSPSRSPDEVGACLFFESDMKGVNVFFRAIPSDAIAFATRCKAPIFVAKQVWQAASFTPVTTTFSATTTSPVITSDYGGGPPSSSPTAAMQALVPTDGDDEPFILSIDQAEDGPAVEEGEVEAEEIRVSPGKRKLRLLEAALSEAIKREDYVEAARLVREEPMLDLADKVEKAIAEERYEDAAAYQTRLDALILDMEQDTDPPSS